MRVIVRNGALIFFLLSASTVVQGDSNNKVRRRRAMTIEEDHQVMETFLQKNPIYEKFVDAVQAMKACSTQTKGGRRDLAPASENPCYHEIASLTRATKHAAVVEFSEKLNRPKTNDPEDPTVFGLVHTVGKIFSDCNEGSGTNNGGGVDQSMIDCCYDSGCDYVIGDTYTDATTGCDVTPLLCDCGDGIGIDDLQFYADCM